MATRPILAIPTFSKSKIAAITEASPRIESDDLPVLSAPKDITEKKERRKRSTSTQDPMMTCSLAIRKSAYERLCRLSSEASVEPGDVNFSWYTRQVLSQHLALVDPIITSDQEV